MFWEKYLPITNFCVSTTALIFQLTVLYPWHHELDAEFKRLKHVRHLQEKRLQRYNQQYKKIALLQSKLEYLKHLQEEKKTLAYHSQLKNIKQLKVTKDKIYSHSVFSGLVMSQEDVGEVESCEVDYVSSDTLDYCSALVSVFYIIEFVSQIVFNYLSAAKSVISQFLGSKGSSCQTVSLKNLLSTSKFLNSSSSSIQLLCLVLARLQQLLFYSLKLTFFLVAFLTLLDLEGAICAFLIVLDIVVSINLASLSLQASKSY